MLEVSRLRINYQNNPIGIGSVDQVGWTLLSDKKNVAQQSYRLQIAADPAFTGLVYDSGVTESAESAHVTVGPLALASSRKYHVRVQVTAAGETAPWTEAFFVTALLDGWDAPFVSAETEGDKDNSKGTYLRGTFTLARKVRAAYAHTTALGLYHLYINGQRVGEDELTPGWTSYNKRLLYQTYDVTELVQTGENAVGGHLGAGWYKGLMGFAGLRNHYGKQTALSCRIIVEYDDGSRAAFGTDAGWMGADSPVVFSEIYDGETYDARLEQPGWDRPGFDDRGWRSVGTVAVDPAILTPQSGGRVRRMTKLPAKRIFKTPGGDTVIDFGQNLTGWICFTAKGRGGDRVELNCFETLDAAGNVYLDNLRGAKETVTYIFGKEGEVSFQPNFSFQGFQYAKISAWPGTPEPDDFTAWAVHTDMEETGFFECSNPDLNQLQHNILWGMKGNFLDIPTDCPQRNERLGWTGDAQIFCRTASFLMDTYIFFSKWLRDVAADQTPEGGVAHVVPDILTGKTDNDWLLRQGTHSAAAWADAAVICPWTLYLTFGDKTVLETQYDSMKGWIEFMRARAVDGIWNYKLQFGDWVALDAEEGSYFGATPNDLTCTAYYAYSTGLFAKTARVLGRTADAEAYGRLYEEIAAGYRRRFFDGTGHLTVQTQTAQIVTLYFGLAPEEYRENVVQDLLRLLEKENGHLVTGFVGTPYFCHVLSQNGHVKEAYDLLLKDDFPSWLYQVRKGATTVWEHWDGLKPDGTMWSPDMNSFNHYAYGAVGEWLYRVVAGIDIDEDAPGYRHAVITPRTGGGLTHVKAAYHSVYGPIRVEWTAAGTVTLDVEIPCNASASIRLADAGDIVDSGSLDFTNQGGVLTAETGSGAYRVVYRLK